jgi:hypothetical protein
MPDVLSQWQNGSVFAGANGVPYILSNSVTQPQAGNYFPWVTTVQDGFSNNSLSGRYTNEAGFRSLISAEIAATNVTVTNAVTLPAARRVIATVDSSQSGVSNTITLQTNAPVHGDYVEVRYVRTADGNNVNIIEPMMPTTNALMSTRSMFWSYSTNVSPARWVPVGGTIGADVVLGALATNNSVPTGSAPTNALLVADGGGFQTTRTNLPSLAIVGSVPRLTMATALGVTYSNVFEYRSSNNTLLINFRDDGAAVFTDNISVGNGPSMHGANGFMLPSGQTFRWSQSGTTYDTADLLFYRDAKGSLGQRNTTNAQTNNIYGSFTNSTNYRRLSVGMSNSGIAFIRPEQAGPLTNGTNFLHISGLPATNTGLPSGVLWNSNGTVMVAP